MHCACSKLLCDIILSSKFLVVVCVIAFYGSALVHAQTSTTTTTSAPPAADWTWETVFVIVVLVLLVFALVLDLVSNLAGLFVCVAVFLLSGVITEKNFFSGFSNSGVASLALIYVLTEPIKSLPVVLKFSRHIFGGETHAATLALAKTLLFCLVSSAVLPNKPQVALLVPLIVEVSKKTNLHPGLLLMPMNVAIHVANFFTISSSSNLVINGLLEEAGLPVISFFEYSKTAIAAAVITSLFMLLFANVVFEAELPADISAANAADTPDDMTSFTCLMHVMSRCRFIGKTLQQLFEELPPEFGRRVIVLKIYKAVASEMIDDPPLAETVIEKDDELLVAGFADHLRAFHHLANLSWVGLAPLDMPSSALRAAAKMLSSHRQQHRRSESTASFTAALEHNKVVDHDSDDSTRRGREPAAPTAPAAGDTQQHNTLHRTSTLRCLHQQVEMVPAQPQQRAAASDEDGDDHHHHHQPNKNSRDEGKGMHRVQTEIVMARAHTTSSEIGGAGEAAQSEGEDEDTDSNVSSSKNNLNSATPMLSPGTPENMQDFVAYRVKPSSSSAALIAFECESNELSDNFVVTLSADNEYVGHTIRTSNIVSKLDCFVLGARSARSGPVPPFRMHLYKLQAGDSLLLRVRKSFFRRHISTGEFINIESVTPQRLEKSLADYYWQVPDFMCDCVGEKIFPRSDDRFVTIPRWYANISLLILVGVIAATMGGVKLNVAAVVGIFVQVALGITTAREAVRAIDWVVVVTTALSFGIGAAITNSGLASIIGHGISSSSLSGYALLLVLSLIAGFLSSLVQDTGAAVVLFPIFADLFKTRGLDVSTAAVVLGNGVIAGFWTPFGCSSNLMIAQPGRYRGRDFVVFGAPVFLVWHLMISALEYAIYVA